MTEETLKIEVIRTLSRIFSRRVEQKELTRFELTAGKIPQEIIARVQLPDHAHTTNFLIRVDETDLWAYQRGSIEKQTPNEGMTE